MSRGQDLEIFAEDSLTAKIDVPGSKRDVPRFQDPHLSRPFPGPWMYAYNALPWLCEL